MPDTVMKLLGTPAIRRGDNTVTPRRHKSLALLAYLIMEPRLHARHRLATLLWPDAGGARKLLRHAVYEIRQCVGSQAVVANRDSIGINASVLECCDVERLHQLADCSDGAATALSPSEIEALCSGEFLEGLEFAECELMADWCYAARELIARRRTRLLAQQVALHRACGHTGTALALLGRWQRLIRSTKAHTDNR